MLESPLNHSIVGRARQQDVVDIKVHDLREYSTDKHNKVDDYPYGGGGGMVLTPQPIFECMKTLKNQRSYDEIIFTAAGGEQFDQKMATQLSLQQNIVILCGHYKGVDQRVRDQLITREISLGDYVLSGGELAAAVITDAIVRLLPGALGDARSALSDSYQDDLLEGPVYTRPDDFRGLKVPEVLKSGDHERIEEWRHQKAIERTKRRRPDLYEKYLDKQ